MRKFAALVTLLGLVAVAAAVGHFVHYGPTDTLALAELKANVTKLCPQLPTYKVHILAGGGVVALFALLLTLMTLFGGSRSGPSTDVLRAEVTEKVRGELTEKLTAELTPKCRAEMQAEVRATHEREIADVKEFFSKELTQKTLEVAARLQEVTQKASALTLREQDLAQRTRELSEKTQELAHTIQELADVRQELAQLKQQMATMSGSGDEAASKQAKLLRDLLQREADLATAQKALSVARAERDVARQEAEAATDKAASIDVKKIRDEATAEGITAGLADGIKQGRAEAEKTVRAEVTEKVRQELVDAVRVEVTDRIRQELTAAVRADVTDAIRSEERAEAQKRAKAEAQAEIRSEKTPAVAYQILHLFQKEGRLLDLLMEDVSGVDDDALGGAIRPIHEGCRKILLDRLVIEPVRPEAENSEITLPADFDHNAIKLTGNVPPVGPYKGVLVHRGWRLTECKLPELVSGWTGNVVAPAEVEIS